MGSLLVSVVHEWGYGARGQLEVVLATHVLVRVSRQHMYLCVSPDDTCTCACLQTTHVLVRVSRRHMYLCVSPDDTCTCACLQTTHVLVRVSRRHMYLCVSPDDTCTCACLQTTHGVLLGYMCNAEVTSADNSDVFAVENISFLVLKTFTIIGTCHGYD